jgi:DNA-binding MarR family transcriptional regulator
MSTTTRGIKLNLHNLFLGVFVPDWVARIPNERVGPQSKLVYGRLLRYAGRRGRCVPHLETIAADLGCSTRTVGRALEELRAEGLITTIRRPNHLAYEFHWHGEITPKDIKDKEQLEKRLREFGYEISLEELFQSGNSGSDKLSDPEKSKPEGVIGQPVRSDLTTCPMHPFEENHRRESLNNVAHTPAPKAFTTSSEATGPKPKLEAFESAPDVGEETADVAEPVDRLAAARAREASLRARASKPKDQTTKRPTSKSSVVKEKNFAPSAKSHSEGSHNPYRSAAAVARREREPSYRSPAELRGVWVEEVHKILPELTVAPWRGREGKMMKDLMGVYTGAEVERLFHYVLRNWPALRRRYFRGKGGPIPSVPTLTRFQDTWMAESLVWEKSHRVVQEVDAWIKENRRAPRGDMLTQYDIAKRELDSLDLES